MVKRPNSAVGGARNLVSFFNKKRKPAFEFAQQLGNIVATAALGKGAQSYTKTNTRGKAVSSNRLSHRGPVRMKMKKRTAINSAKKSKRSRKFQAKVMKALKDTKCYGEYVYIAGAQLRQVNTDRLGMKYTDYNGRLIAIGDLKANIDAYSLAFGGKLMGNDYRNATGNINSVSTFNTVFENLHFYFKSTSSHVVNIEVVECTAKTNYKFAERPEVMVNESMNDYVSRWAASNVSAEQALTASTMGLGIRHYTSLFQYYTVKTHKVKLLPGATSSLSFSRKAKTWEQSKYRDSSDALCDITKGASYFFFRTINDPTVSGTPPAGESTVHRWPSNSQGGVALHYTRTIRVTPNSIATSAGTAIGERPAIIVGNWVSFPAEESDQQVVYQNPISVSTSGN